MQSTNSRGDNNSSMLYQDLIDGMVWPKLIRAGGLALRPDRIGLGVAIVVLLGLIQKIGLLWHDSDASGEFEGLASSVSQHAALSTSVIFTGATTIDKVSFFITQLVGLPSAIIQENPLLSVLVLGPIMLLVWAVLGGAISRGVMSEVSLAKVPAWPELLGGALKRWPSLLGALLVPLVLVAGCWYLIAFFGLGLHVPVLNIASALLFGLGVIFSLAATLVLIAYAIGGWMLVPAVMAEGTDALDGVQRSLAYVWSRPLRSVIYLVILTTMGFIAVSIASWVGALSVDFATRAAGTWGPTNARGVLDLASDGTEGIAAKIIGFWETLVTVIIAGYTVSYIHTAGAMQYLCLRFVCDGQEIGELWEESA